MAAGSFYVQDNLDTAQESTESNAKSSFFSGTEPYEEVANIAATLADLQAAQTDIDAKKAAVDASAAAAAVSETNAASSAAAANSSAGASSDSASASSGSASAAATSASNAATSASSASSSATSASDSVTSASNSASAASTSETNAANSAAAASTSETNAANSAADAVTSASNAATSAANAASAADAEIAAKAVRFDTAQTLTSGQKAQSQSNMGLAAVAGSGSAADISFARSAANAVPVSVLDRLELVGYYPKDFWKAIDADDTNSVTSALAAAETDHGVLLLEAKEYIINALGINVQNKVVIRGMSRDKTTLTYSGSGNLLTVSNSFYLHISDVKFNVTNANARAIQAFAMSGPQIIERCHFLGGIHQVNLTSQTTTSGGCYGWVIRDNVFENAVSIGLRIYALAAGAGLTQAIWIENNEFWGFSQWAIYAGGASGIWVINNWIERHIASTQSAVHFDNSNLIGFSRNYCEDEADFPFIDSSAVAHGVCSENYMSVNVAAGAHLKTAALSYDTGFWSFLNNTVSVGGSNPDVVNVGGGKLYTRGNKIDAAVTGWVFEIGSGGVIDYEPGSDLITGSTQIYHCVTAAPATAKVFVRFNGAGTPTTSYGVASVTRTATGKYTIALTNPLPTPYPSVLVSGPAISDGTNLCIPQVVENGDPINIFVEMVSLANGAIGTTDASSVSVAVFAQ